ncbi:MAG TPA: DUF6448 family protein [candidate division Zixibacteria bacterium]|nr:DUF6448 family protein [candidate division Zixibacteria bacterium]
MSCRNLVTALCVAFLLALVLTSDTALSHCDSEDGPIIPLIRTSLENGDVTPLLKWLTPADEAEIVDLFQRVRALRAESTAAQEIADRLFIDTFIRLHRAGEGAPFTGIQPAGSIPPIFVELDHALETGSVTEVADHLAQEVREEIVQRFNHAAELRKRQDVSVEDGRRFVEAYVTYMHFVEGLQHYLAGGETGHHVKPDNEAGH